MPFSSRSYVNRYVPSNRFPVGLKWLLIANIGIFVVSYILSRVSIVGQVLSSLTLVPAEVVHRLALWQLVTYLFIHAGIGDILWNMLALWMFGAQLERLWGTAKFLRFYFACGVLAGLTFLVAAFLFHASNTAAMGSSGAVYGLLTAYGLMFPDQTILFSFIFPMKSKYFVMIIGGIIFLQSYVATIGGAPGTSVAVVAQLGGLVAGFLLLRGTKMKFSVREPVRATYKEWKLRRAKRKFEVYLRKKDPKRDRWVQ